MAEIAEDFEAAMKRALKQAAKGETVDLGSFASHVTEPEKLMTPKEVAQLFRVSPKTVARWSRDGKLPAAIRTVGGHRRFRAVEVEAVREGLTGDYEDGQG